MHDASERQPDRKAMLGGERGQLPQSLLGAAVVAPKQFQESGVDQREGDRMRMPQLPAPAQRLLAESMRLIRLAEDQAIPAEIGQRHRAHVVAGDRYERVMVLWAIQVQDVLEMVAGSGELAELMQADAHRAMAHHGTGRVARAAAASRSAATSRIAAYSARVW